MPPFPAAWGHDVDLRKEKVEPMPSWPHVLPGHSTVALVGPQETSVSLATESSESVGLTQQNPLKMALGARFPRESAQGAGLGRL